MILRAVFYLSFLLFVVVMSWLAYRRLSPAYKWLTILISLAFISESIANVFRFTMISTCPPYHFLIPVDMVLYAVVYLKLLETEKTIRPLIFFLLVAGMGVYGYYEAKYASLFAFPSEQLISLCIMVVFYSLLLFYVMLKRNVNVPLRNQAMFWFNIGSLVFFCVNFFYFGFYKQLISGMQKAPEWGQNLLYASNFVLYGTYLVAILIDKNTNEIERR